jgi:hypothetical protein
VLINFNAETIDWVLEHHSKLQLFFVIHMILTYLHVSCMQYLRVEYAFISYYNEGFTKRHLDPCGISVTRFSTVCSLEFSTRTGEKINIKEHQKNVP